MQTVAQKNMICKEISFDLVDNFRFEGGNNTGIVKSREFLVHLMKHGSRLEM